MPKIVIRHLTGARANQVDEFPATGPQELIAGRDGAAQVRFNPDRDDLVSRQHLKMAGDAASPNTFQLTDLQSRNGTFLNQKRIYGATRLNHGDVVQLGAGGPEFRFEVDPPPVGGPSKPTREASMETMGGFGPKPTRESFSSNPNQPRPVGKATVERMLGDVFTRVKRESNRSLWVGVMVLIAILAVGSVVWLYLRQSQLDQAAAQEQNLKSLQRVNDELKKNPAASNALKAEIAKLEAELKQSDQRNQATAQALLEEVKKRLEEAAAKPPADAAAFAPVPAPEPIATNAAANAAATPAPAQPVPVAAASGPTFETLMEQATEEYQHGRAKAALDLVNTAIAKDANRWESYQFAGQLAGVLNDYVLANAMLQKALQLAPVDYRRDLQYMLDDVKEKMAKK